MSSRTSSHLTSSSSVMTCASEVPTCCPISAFTMCTVVLPSGVIVNQIEGVNASMPSAAPAGATVPRRPGPSAIPSMTPAPVAVERTKNSRRVMPGWVALPAEVVCWFVSAILQALPQDLAPTLHGVHDARIGRAPAQIPVHGLHDLFLGWVRGTGEERRCLHDLTRLTVPALGHLQLDPGSLDGVVVRGVQALDGRDQRPFRHVCERDQARTLRASVDVHRAGSAQPQPAAVLRAGEP